MGHAPLHTVVHAVVHWCMRAALPNPRWCHLQAGDYYPINLLKPRFNMSAPLEVIDEDTPDGKHMLLFNVHSMTWDDPLQDTLFSASASQ
jgi:hypothetical protein